MQLASNVRVKGFPWTIFPVLSTYTAHAVYPNVYIPRHIYVDLKKEKPNPKYVSVLIHEQTHIKRQKKMGSIKWVMKYALSSSFRLEEELVAIKEAMIYEKKMKLKWDTEKSAKFLSSYLYLWCVSYREAKEKLDEIWKNI